MTLTNSEFYGLDEDIIGDGQTDQSTRPLSEYYERRLENNNQYLHGLDWKVGFQCWQPDADNLSVSADGIPTNARRLASYVSNWGKRTGRGADTRPSFLFSIPVFIYPDTKNIRVTMRGLVNSMPDLLDMDYGNKGSPSGSRNEAGKSVSVHGYIVPFHKPKIPFDEVHIGKREKRWLSTNNPVHRLEVPVFRDVQKELPACLMIGFNSTALGQAWSPFWSSVELYDDATIQQWKRHILNLSNSNLDHSTGDGDGDNIDQFISRASEDTIIEIARNSEFDRYELTMANRFDHKVGTNGMSSSMDINVDRFVDKIITRFGNSITPQSWVFEARCDKTASVDTFDAKKPGSMKANEIVNGKDIGQHGGNTDVSYRKGRLKAIGPQWGEGATAQAEPPWDDGWDGPKNRRWRWARFDQAASSPADKNTLDRLSVRVDKGGSELRVINQYVTVSHWNMLGAMTGLTINGDPQFIEGNFGMRDTDDPSPSQLRIESGATIDFSYQLRQNGSSATNEIVSSATYPEPDQDIWTAVILNKYPILRTVLEAFHSDTDGLDEYGYSHRDENENWGQTFREGWTGLSDLNVIVSTVINSISVPDDATTDFSRPFELTVHISGTSDIQAEYTNSGGSTIDHPLDQIVCVNLQTAVWEFPG